MASAIMRWPGSVVIRLVPGNGDVEVAATMICTAVSVYSR